MLFLLGDCCFWLDNPCIRRACPPWVRTCGACRLSWWVCWPWASEWWSSTVTSPASPPPGAPSASLGRKWEHLSLGFGLHGGVSPWLVMSKSGPPHSLAARCLLAALSLSPDQLELVALSRDLQHAGAFCSPGFCANRNWFCPKR